MPSDRASFELMGAGNAEVNGRYAPQGVMNGRPAYQHETDQRFKAEWRSQAWHIVMNRNGAALKLYKNGKDSDTLPQTGWEAFSGQGPAPLVRSDELLQNCKVPLWPVSLMATPILAFQHEGEAWMITPHSSTSLRHALEEMPVGLSCKRVEDSIKTFTLKPQADATDDRGRLLQQAIFQGGLQGWSNFPAVQALLHRDIVLLNTAIPGRPLADYSLEVVVAYVQSDSPLASSRTGLLNCADARLRDLGIDRTGSAVICFRIADFLREPNSRFQDDSNASLQEKEGLEDWGSQMESLMSCLGSVSSPGCESFQALAPITSGLTVSAAASGPCDPEPETPRAAATPF